MLASGKCFSVLAKGVGLGGFKGGAEEQQQLSPECEAGSLLKALGSNGSRWGPTAPGRLRQLKSRVSPVVGLKHKSQGKAKFF